MADGGLLLAEAKEEPRQPRSHDRRRRRHRCSWRPAPAPAPAPAAPPRPLRSEDAKRAAVGMPPKKGFLRTMLGMAGGGHVVGPGGPREDQRDARYAVER